jgi:hypothetical protein
MTLFQSEPQQHRREAKDRTCRAARRPDLSPDSHSEQCCRNEASDCNSVLRNSISRATPGRSGGPPPKSFRCRLEFVLPRSGKGGVGASRRGHQRGHGSGRVGPSVQQKHYENPHMFAPLGEFTTRMASLSFALTSPFRDPSLLRVHLQGLLVRHLLAL